jgi:hypothetical protein
MSQLRKQLLLICIAVVGLTATAGRLAFVHWAWPRLSEPVTPIATLEEKLFDLGLLSLLVVHELVFQIPLIARLLDSWLHGCYRALYAWIRGLLLVTLAVAWVPWGGAALSESVVLLWAARGAFCLGVLLYLMASAAYGNGVLLGFDALRRRVEGRPQLPLWAQEGPVYRGPFASTRQPMALALSVLFLSGAFFQRERLLLAVGAILWLTLSARAREQKWLRSGDMAYRRYHERTGFLFPRRRD